MTHYVRAHQADDFLSRDAAVPKCGDNLCEMACSVQDSGIRQYPLDSRGNFCRRRTFVDGSPNARGRDTVRVIRLISALPDANQRHARRQRRGDSTEPAMGDDSRHM